MLVSSNSVTGGTNLLVKSLADSNEHKMNIVVFIELSKLSKKGLTSAFHRRVSHEQIRIIR